MNYFKNSYVAILSKYKLFRFDLKSNLNQSLKGFLSDIQSGITPSFDLFKLVAIAVIVDIAIGVTIGYWIWG